MQRATPPSGFIDELPEVFERFGRIGVRRMFGGHGVFHEGRMFALVFGRRLYLKTDEESRPQFEARKLSPFEYTRQGELTSISYLEAPPEIYEDRDEAARWARLAWDAVIRKGMAGRRKTTKATKTTKTKPTQKARTSAR